MSRHGPIVLPPTRTDLAVAHAWVRGASPQLERTIEIASWLADERAMLGLAGLIWIASRWGPAAPVRREADRMICTITLNSLSRPC